MPTHELTDAVSPEEAVRAYLMYLDDLELVDAAAVKKAQNAVEKAKDPIEHLKALASLERAQATDETVYRADFVKLAKSWADEESVPASAFRELGVPADVLAAAGQRAAQGAQAFTSRHRSSLAPSCYHGRSARGRDTGHGRALHGQGGHRPCGR